MRLCLSVGVAGLEPATSPLWEDCSTTELYSHAIYSSLQVNEVHLFNFKARTRAIFTSDTWLLNSAVSGSSRGRTYNIRLKRALLCQLSYTPFNILQIERSRWDLNPREKYQFCRLTPSTTWLLDLVHQSDSPNGTRTRIACLKDRWISPYSMGPFGGRRKI